MKVLVVGPSPEKSKGGMATVVAEIRDDKELAEQYKIDIFDSYVDGSKGKRMLYSVYAFIRFYLTKRDYDIYHIHVASRGSTTRKGYYARAAKRWGKKVILHIHGARYMEFYDEAPEKKKKQIVAFLKNADLVIALSEDWKEKFDRTFGLTNCVVLENGIHLERLEPAISSPEENHYAFVTLGRLGQRKGTYDLVEAVEIAAKTLPDIRVYLAGDGDVEQVKQFVQQKDLTQNVEVIGWADFDRKLELLKQVSTVVLPSYSEGLPMSILEGMACKKAIISTKVGAIPEVVKEENGILVDAGDIPALADALVRCSKDPQMIRAMGEANYAKIQNEFSMRQMHKQLAKYYERVF